MSDPIAQIFERLEELERMVKQMVVRGRIHEVDAKKALARVAYGEGLITGWIPWKPVRTGKAVVWWVPEVGEGVTVISSGSVSQGEIFAGSYYDDFPAPSSDPEKFLIEFGDGSRVQHCRTTGKLDVVNVGDVEITTQQNLTITTTGNVMVKSGAVYINGGTADQGAVRRSDLCLVTGTPHANCSNTVFIGD